MKFPIIICLCVAASALPFPEDRGYRFSAPATQFSHRQASGGFAAGGAGFAQPAPAGPAFVSGGAGFGQQASAGGFGLGHADRDDSDESGGFAVGGGAARFDGCGHGLLRHVDGSCVEPQVGSSVFLYNAPHIASHLARADLSAIGRPRVNYNIVFVRTPEGAADLEPVVIPPPQQRTLVYVLARGDSSSQRVIEIPDGPAHAPEVFYVNTDEGANPQLPIGIDLRSALESAAAQQGHLLEGGAAGAGFGAGAGAGFGAATRAGFGAAAGAGFGASTGAGFGGFDDSSVEDSGFAGASRASIPAPSRTYGK